MLKPASRAETIDPGHDQGQPCGGSPSKTFAVPSPQRAICSQKAPPVVRVYSERRVAEANALGIAVENRKERVPRQGVGHRFASAGAWAAFVIASVERAKASSLRPSAHSICASIDGAV